jgi:cell wall-associated NlpC family hydrolase
MKPLNKKRIAKVFGAYVLSMFLGGVAVNAVLGTNVFNVPFVANASDMDKFADKLQCLMESRVKAINIEHSDITGLKSITRKRRNKSEETVSTNPNASFASYKHQPLPPVPVEYQGVLNDEKRAEIRAKITGVAKQYLGRPYVYAAKGPNAFDCSGYTSYILRQFGIMISPGSRYQATQGRHVDLAAAKVGDLLYFSAYGKGGVITHVGLIIDNAADGITVIHANGPRHGIMIENVTKSSYWRNKILFARDVISGDSKAALAER